MTRYYILNNFIFTTTLRQLFYIIVLFLTKTIYIERG